MKIKSYHKANDQLTECAREASEQNQPEVVEMVNEARVQVHRAWSRLVELEQGSASSGEPTQDFFSYCPSPEGRKFFGE